MRFLRIIFRGVFLAAILAFVGLVMLVLRRLSAKSRVAPPRPRAPKPSDSDVIEVTATEVEAVTHDVPRR